MAKRTAILLTAVALAAVGSGCGGSNGGRAHVASSAGHPDPAAIASKIGCTGYKAQDGQIELFAATEGDCTYNGSSVTILTFASTGSFGKWRDAAKQATGADGTLVLGDRYAVEANNADTASAIASTIGGTTQ